MKDQTVTSLLRAVVAAKIAYWDALGELETLIAPNGEFSDRANDSVIEAIDGMAAADGDPGEAEAREIEQLGMV